MNTSFDRVSRVAFEQRMMSVDDNRRTNIDLGTISKGDPAVFIC